MTGNHHDLAEFLDRRLADRGNRDNSPEREILVALIGSSVAVRRRPSASPITQAARSRAVGERGTYRSEYN
jgi:hypothetical protein